MNKVEEVNGPIEDIENCFATLIDNYGVRIPDESEMFRIPYLDEKDIPDDVKSEDIQRDVSDTDDDIDI